MWTLHASEEKTSCFLLIGYEEDMYALQEFMADEGAEECAQSYSVSRQDHSVMKLYCPVLLNIKVQSTAAAAVPTTAAKKPSILQRLIRSIESPDPAATAKPLQPGYLSPELLNYSKLHAVLRDTKDPRVAEEVLGSGLIPLFIRVLGEYSHTRPLQDALKDIPVSVDPAAGVHPVRLQTRYRDQADRAAEVVGMLLQLTREKESPGAGRKKQRRRKKEIIPFIM